MRKYGFDNFKFEVIEECKKDLLDTKEAYYIELYKSYVKDFGYNQTKIINKKSVSSILNESDILSIINHLKDNILDMDEISKLFNVSKSTIKNINLGYYHVLDNETYPVRNSLLFTKNKNKKNSEVNRKNTIVSRAKNCNKCGIEFYSTDSNRIFCSVNCSNENQKRFDWPNEEVLLDFLKDGMIFKDIAKRYSVSENAIRKLMKKYSDEFYNNCLFLNEKNKVLRSKTGLKNVSFAKNKTNPFQVCFYIEGRSVNKGSYPNEIEAAKVADYWIKELYKGNAYTNLELGLVVY